jgi:hypothetical protein
MGKQMHSPHWMYGWEDNVKMNLKETENGDAGWIPLVGVAVGSKEAVMKPSG